MFTGIIQAAGIVDRLERRAGTTRITIHAPDCAHTLRVGDSIAVNGTCLTALEMIPPLFSADLAAETLARTTLSMLQPGSIVNLELPTPAGAPLGGHIVQGHVDGRGELVSFDPLNETVNPGDTDWSLRIQVPQAIHAFMLEKGSVAVDGISLTVAAWDGETIGIAVLPHTRNLTNLRVLRPGDSVNLEADVMIKLALNQRRVRRPRFEPTPEYLLANGY